MNSAGTVVATANPPDALGASLTYTVPTPGVYYVTVRGTGKGDPLDIGYTAYASVGYFGLTVTCSQGAAPCPSCLRRVQPLGPRP